MSDEKLNIEVPAKKRRELSELNVIDDFLITSILTFQDKGKKAAKIMLQVFLGQELEVVDVVPQKVINGASTSNHGIRLDAYIKAKSDGEKAATLYDIEPENRVADKRILPRRNRYYSSMIDKQNLTTNVDYDNLPNLVIITILSYDPFDQRDMYYEAKTSLITHPRCEYDDGIRRIFLYTKGKCNIPDDGGRKISEMLKYIQSSKAENVSNTDIKALDDIVTSVKQSQEVNLAYMKSWEYEAALREDLRAELKDEVIEEVKAEVTEDITVKNAFIFISNLRKYHAPEEDILDDLITEWHIPEAKAKELMAQK